jgi:restriction system protein
MTIPKFDEMYKEILIVISDDKVHNNEDLRNSVAQMKGVTDEERTTLLKSGIKRVFDDRINWARTYLKAAGLLDYPQRGKTQITEEGKRVLSQNHDVIDNKFLNNYVSNRSFNSNSQSDIDTEIQSTITPIERIETAIAEINSSLAGELITEILSHPPKFFENLVVKLLVKMGYGGSLGDEAGSITPLSRDAGIDGVIREDKLGFSNIFIQAKCWNPVNTVERPEIQTFVGAIANKAGTGLFITTAKFSDGAKQCAKENHIVLIDGNHLTSLMIEHSVGVSTKQTYAVKNIDSDFFAE